MNDIASDPIANAVEEVARLRAALADISDALTAAGVTSAHGSHADRVRVLASDRDALAAEISDVERTLSAAHVDESLGEVGTRVRALLAETEDERDDALADVKHINSKLLTARAEAERTRKAAADMRDICANMASEFGYTLLAMRIRALKVDP